MKIIEIKKKSSKPRTTANISPFVRIFPILDWQNWTVALLFLLVAIVKLSKAINVALHAQLDPSSGTIVGSAITTQGMKNAFLKRDDIGTVNIYYPFTYIGFHSVEWDIFIIEGWFHSINAIIHEVRKFSPKVKVLFFCLDPNYPGMSIITSLDVDGYMTNSHTILQELSAISPSIFLLLAADIETMKPSEGERNEDTTAKFEQRKRRIVYVGIAGAIEFKHMLPQFLREAMPYGLEIWGSGWGGYEEFSPFWKGVLPKEELPNLYRTSAVVLCVTMDGQRNEGMVNNRVFEALACGAAILTDHFPELEALLGKERSPGPVMYIRHPEEISQKLQMFMSLNSSEITEISRQARLLVEQNHTWTNRVGKVMDFYYSLCQHSPEKESECLRANCLRVALFPEPSLFEDILFHTSFEAAVQKLKTNYVFTWYNSQIDAAPVLINWDNFDMVWAIGKWNSSVYRVVHQLETRITSRSLKQLKAWVMWGEVYPENDSVQNFDVVFYTTEYDRRELQKFGLSVQHAFGVAAPLSISSKRTVDSFEYFAASIGPLDERVQHQLTLADSNEGRVALIVNSLSHNAIKATLSLNGSVDIFWLTPSERRTPQSQAVNELFRIMLSSKKIVVASQLGGGGEWALSACLLLEIPVLIVPGNPRILEHANLYPAWDDQHYASGLALGVTRMLCLGTSKTAIQITSPQTNSSILGRFIPVKVNLDDFEIPRDGEYCVFVNGHLTLCLRQVHLLLLLNITSSSTSAPRAAALTLHADVKSNIYADIVATSPKVFVEADVQFDNSNEIEQTFFEYKENFVLYQYDVDK